uniref:Uncharacterized protein n=1 Tax=Marmota marmota marmota TaxID=9994 RepID=A0A8C5ZCQ6_MARMA
MFSCCTLKPKSVTINTVTKVLGLQSCLLYKENFQCCCELMSSIVFKISFLLSIFTHKCYYNACLVKEERLNKGKNFNSTEFAIISLT